MATPAPTPTRTIRCYHCQHRFDTSAHTMSTSCPKCYRSLIVEDVIIKTAHAVRKVQTCGRVVIEPKGRLIAQNVESQLGVEVLGALEGNVVSGGPVRIGAKAVWKGDCRAPSLLVELGAQITRGYFVVPYDAETPEPAEVGTPPPPPHAPTPPSTPAVASTPAPRSAPPIVVRPRNLDRSG